MENHDSEHPVRLGKEIFPWATSSLSWKSRFKPREWRPRMRSPLGSEPFQLGIPRLSLRDVKLQLDGVLRSSRRVFLWQVLHKLPMKVPPSALANLLGKPRTRNFSVLFGPLTSKESL